jgi:hypothetical protein
MTYLKPHLLVVPLAFISLLACERDNYTTWTCASSKDPKISMILKKAQMQFQDLQFDYCGSLGERSYFAQKCPANIQESDYTFTPATGVLLSNHQQFQCSAL